MLRIYYFTYPTSICMPGTVLGVTGEQRRHMAPTLLGLTFSGGGRWVI